MGSPWLQALNYRVMMPSSCTGTFLKRPLLSFYFSRLPPTIRDPRNPAAPLRTHASTHSDDITSVQFSRSPESSHVLLSASSDGLLCTTDAREDDEDEAGLHVGNWGCSIAQSGWVRGNTNTRGIWAASDMETFSVWTGEVSLINDLLSAHHANNYDSWIKLKISISGNPQYIDKTSLGSRIT